MGRHSLRGKWILSISIDTRLEQVSTVSSAVEKGKTYAIEEIATTCGAECFNGKNFTLFHFGLVFGLDKGDRLAPVDLPLLDVVAADIPHGFHGHSSTIDVDFVAFHRLLNGSTDIADTNIDTGILLTRVSAKKEK